jgi:hypothetical protein
MIRSIEKIHLIGIQTLDLPTCSIVPQPNTLPRAPFVYHDSNNNTMFQMSDALKILVWKSEG